MFIVMIVPISRSIPLESLPYLTSENFSIGSLVRAPFQKTEYTGFVIDCVDATTMRAEIKTAGFQLRGGVNHLNKQLPEKYIEMYIEYCIENKSSISTVSHTVLNPLLDFLLSFEIQTQAQNGLVLQSDLQARKAYYAEKSLKKNRLILVPNSVYATNYAKELGFVSITTKPQCKKILSIGNEEQESLTIFSTLEFLPELVGFCSDIVFESINNHGYALWTSKDTYINRIPLLVNLLRYSTKHTISIADCVLPLPDTKKSYEEEGCQNLSWSVPKVELLHSEREKNKTLETTEFTIWLKNFINKGLTSGIIVCNQREWFGYTVCNFCGYNKKCPNCESFLRTKRQMNNSLLFYCATCGHTEPVWDLCTGCGGYTLQSNRIGIDNYAKLITDTVTIPVYTITSETKGATKQWQKWQETGGILVTTSSIFNYPPTNNCQSMYIANSFIPESAEQKNPETLLSQCFTLCEYSSQVVFPQKLWERVLYFNKEQHPKQRQLPKEKITNWQDQANHELEQAEKYKIKLSCVFW